MQKYSILKSYQLGVHGPEADVNTLCVGPGYTFHCFKDTQEVSEVQYVKNENVPLSYRTDTSVGTQNWEFPFHPEMY